MFGTEIDLGSSLHIHSKHKLRLAVIASARISFPGPDAWFLTSLTLPEIFNSRDTWVSLGSELKLTADIHLNGTASTASRSNLALTEIGPILEHADFWSALGLVTSRKDPRTTLGYEGSTRLVRIIQPDFTASQSTRTKSPTKQVCDINIHPPEGIPAAILQEIKVSFHFEPEVSVSKRRTHPKIRQGEETFDDLLFELDYFDPDQIGPIGTPGLVPPELIKAQDAVSVSQFHSSIGNYGDYLECDSAFSSQETQVSLPLPCQNQATTKNATERVNIEPFAMLIDSGFRGLMCDKPIRAAAGIKAHFDGPRIKLAETAPAIFSPHYLTSMSQRAGYIPMIAKSLNTMLERSRSMRLKAKTKSLEEAYRSRTGVIDEETTDKPNTRRNLKCLLWMSLQRGVFDPGAARRLPPLHTSRANISRGQERYPDLPYPSKIVDPGPTIDIPDEPSFNQEIPPETLTNEDPYNDLLFSELGLQEDTDILDDGIRSHQDMDIDLEGDFFDYFELPQLSQKQSPTQHTPYDDIDLDYDLLDNNLTSPAEPPPPRRNSNSPALPITNPIPIPMDMDMDMDMIQSSPSLPPTATHIDPIILPDSDI